MGTRDAPRQGDGEGAAIATDGGARAAGEPRGQATLFDAHGGDRDLELREADVGELGDHQLLWIDVAGAVGEDVVALLDRLGVPVDVQPYLLQPTGKPSADDRGDTLHVEVSTLIDPVDSETTSLVCLVGRGWVVTAHGGPVPVLDDFRERASGGASWVRWTRPRSWRASWNGS